MRIVTVELRRVQIPMKRAFKHALHERRHTDGVFVALTTDDGVTGWGEILPRSYVTGETIAGVLEEHGPKAARWLLERTFTAMDEVPRALDVLAGELGPALATTCGFDLALFDAAGRSFGIPVAEVLGGATRPELPPGVIVGFETKTESLARYCAALRLAGKRHVKVKVGLPDDLERLALVAKVFKQIPLRLDANAAWSVDQAIDTLRRMRDVAPIASIEQPIDAGNLAGLREIRERTGIKVMADESVCSLADAQALVLERAADIFNVRLGKNGGLRAAQRLVEYAVDHGVEVHLGTMVGESGVLSQASEIFGRCVGAFECLDGKGQNAFLLEVDILEESSEHPFGPTAAPGLGFRVSTTRLQDHQVGPILRFSLT